MGIRFEWRKGYPGDRGRLVVYVKETGDEKEVLDFDPLAFVRSVPPNGCYRVKNFYVDTNGKFVVEYDDEPMP